MFPIELTKPSELWENAKTIIILKIPVRCAALQRGYRSLSGQPEGKSLVPEKNCPLRVARGLVLRGEPVRVDNGDHLKIRNSSGGP